MEKFKSLVGKVVLNENSKVIFTGMVFENLLLNANGSDVVFEECFLHNDIKIINCNNVSFSNCTFIFNSYEKKNSVNVNAENISVNNVLIDDLEKSDSLVRFSCYSISLDTFTYMTNKNKKSVLDICSNNFSLKNCFIDAEKNFYKKTLNSVKTLKKVNI